MRASQHGAGSGRPTPDSSKTVPEDCRTSCECTSQDKASAVSLHPALRGLARLLARQAACEWLRQQRAGEGDEPFLPNLHDGRAEP